MKKELKNIFHFVDCKRGNKDIEVAISFKDILTHVLIKKENCYEIQIQLLNGENHFVQFNIPERNQYDDFLLKHDEYLNVQGE